MCVYVRTCVRVCVVYIYKVRRGNCLMSRVFANGPADQGSIQGRVIPTSMIK